MPSHPYASGGHNYYAAAFPTMPAAAPQPNLAPGWAQPQRSAAQGNIGKDHLHYYGQVCTYSHPSSALSWCNLQSARSQIILDPVSSRFCSK